MKKILLLSVIVTSLAFGLELDPQKSSFKWEGTKKVGEGHSGQIFLKSSKVIDENGELTGGEFVMDMNSFTVGNLEGKWMDKFLNHMKSKDFFDVEKYPTSTLIISEIKDGKVFGQLTIMDKTNPVEFAIHKTETGFEGTMAFDRTKFGMVYGSDNFFKNLGDKVINDQVTLTFNVVLK